MPLTCASGLVKSPCRSRPPLKRWKTPTKWPSPATRHGSFAKKISFIRGKFTVDATFHVISGKCVMSAEPVTSVFAPSEIRSSRLNRTVPPSMVNQPCMSARIGRYC